MKMQVRTVLMLIALATMGLTGCGHYTCGANFGNSTCNGGPASLTGSGSGNAAAAFVFVSSGNASSGQMAGYTLNTSVNPPTLSTTPNYTPPATPAFEIGRASCR